MNTERYKRHKELLDKTAWNRLCSTPIITAGAGGLGSHVLMTLARLAPVTIEIWDPGLLDAPDLNRQILYEEQDIGQLKTVAAARHLQSINSSLIIHHQPMALTFENFSAYSNFGSALHAHHEGKTIQAEPASGKDSDFNPESNHNFNPASPSPFVVFDCLDSFAARYELESLRKAYGCPIFHGGVEGWFGQVFTFLPMGKGFADLFGEEFSHMRKAAKPIMPQTVSAIASFQVGEYMHWCMHPHKTPLSEAMLVYNGMTMSTDTIVIQ